MSIRALGLYLIAILILLRFVIYPLQSNLEERKVLLGDQVENYQIKMRILERQKENPEAKTAVDRDALSPHLYEKGESNSYIQSDILQQVIKMAEGKGLAVMNFEMLEPIAGKKITELPVLIRVKGKVEGFAEIMGEIEKHKKILSIRSMEISRSGTDQILHLTLSTFKLEI